MAEFDVVVIGSGPNGLSAAIEIARAGVPVCVLEAVETIGGGTRTGQLTLPGFLHDVCSAIHPMALVSPFFRMIEIEKWGVKWVRPPAAVAHPLEDSTAAVLYPDVGRTCETLGKDAAAYRKLLEPFLERTGALFDEILRPVRFPSRPLLMARFGALALRSCRGLANGRFCGPNASALFAGCSAHSFLPLDAAGSAAFGLVLALAGHAVGWPFPESGSRAIADALSACLTALGGLVFAGRPVHSTKDLPPARAYVFDVTPAQLLAIAGDSLPSRYRGRLSGFQYGPGVFKIDWALNAPIPWTARECRQAATVHVGGTLDEIASGESEVGQGRHPERPFVLVGQQSLFDSSRAPAGMHTAWGYCHVPNGSEADMTVRIESQIERFAPGFGDTILARHTMTAMQMQSHNANLIGGDISGGSNKVRQIIARPVFRLDPYSTPNPRIFLCSSSTPPGGGVHGMCGYLAARSVLRRVLGKG